MTTRSMTDNMMKGDLVLRRGTTTKAGWRKRAGVLTGAMYRCQMESCGGLRIVVRWPDGRITRPCGKGIDLYQAGSASTNFRHVWRIV